jgi:hypothetical protein
MLLNSQIRKRMFILGMGQNCKFAVAPIARGSAAATYFILLLDGPLQPAAWAVSPGFGERRNAGQLRCLRNVASFPCQVRICEKSADIVHYRSALTIDALMRE